MMEIMYEAVKHNELIKLVDDLASNENYDYSDSDLDYSIEYGQYPYFEGRFFDFHFVIGLAAKL